MGLEKVKDDVLEKAKHEAAKLAAEAEDEAKRIKREKAKASEALSREAEKKLEAQKSEMISRAVSSAELEAKKEMLNARKDIINRIFAEAKRRLKAIPQSRRNSHIAKLLEIAGRELEIARVYCNESDLKNIQGFNAEKAEIIGGIIAENKEGTVRVDLSYDSLLEEVYRESLKEVSEVLFRK
ncbi:MAG: V-type ATP synthase subunit E family protein [Candidatus Woesearchaeota archaeon]